jgi:hypothetical protein
LLGKIGGAEDTALAFEEVAKQPDDCEPTRAPPPHLRKPTKAPEIEGFKAGKVLVEGDLGVATGHKTPGTAVPQVMGFDPETREVRWHQQIAEGDPLELRAITSHHGLAEQSYVASYEKGSGNFRLAAFHPMTGAPKWDVAVEDRLRELVVGEKFVYLVKFTELDILDAETGEKIATLGG